jgi:glycerol-3-phosphate O-acyltransferase
MIETVQTPLLGFSEIRPRILDSVVSRTLEEFFASGSGAAPEQLLGEALYLERLRMRHGRDNLWTRGRTVRDRKLWGEIQSGLLRPAGRVDRKQLLEKSIRHFAEEIGGRFDPRVYQFATGAVPYFFNWMFNAASLKHFMPWKQKDLLHHQLKIGGEVDHLRKLATKGTILLVPTHQSNIDSVMIGYIIYQMGLGPFSYGAGLNLFQNPLLSFFMSNLGAYTVDRRKTNLIYKQTLKNYSTAILREGVHSIFFPGGGRSRSGAIESKLKLGLLGTALDAQVENLIAGRERPNVYVVPMVMSYHYVLEAASLVEDYLAEAGKHRYLGTDDEDTFQPLRVAKFFWKLFSAHSKVTVRVGKPLDVFGNCVDEEGRSVGPNGTTIDPKSWFTTRGVLCKNPQRDREYTLRLGASIVERFHADNTVLSSHLVAFSYFETLRSQYPDLDLYRFLRLSPEQRTLSFEKFRQGLERHREQLLAKASSGELHLCPEITGDPLKDSDVWIREGVRQLGQMHDLAVLKIEGDEVTTDDLGLLYYYRNRLSGYGLSLRSHELKGQMKGAHDRKGFLA